MSEGESYTTIESSDGKLSFEDCLDRFGSLTYRNKGVSMMPLLKEGRDLFSLIPKGAGRCKKYDVVLYRNSKGQYVLHRIVKVRPDDYVIRGDNTYSDEYHKDSDILAVMTSFVHKGKEHTVDEAGYRLYSVLRTQSYPIRKQYIKLRRFGGKILRRLGLRK